jgi:hypothetical protein
VKALHKLAVHIGEADGTLVPRLGKSDVGGFAEELHGPRIEPPQGFKRDGATSKCFSDAFIYGPSSGAPLYAWRGGAPPLGRLCLSVSRAFVLVMFWCSYAAQLELQVAVLGGGQGSRVPAEGCRYRYMYSQIEKCEYRTVRTGGLGPKLLIYWGKGYLAGYQGMRVELRYLTFCNSFQR